jgi:hypothetical protein
MPRLLAGVDGLAFIDVDDTIRQVHADAKQGAAYGYSGIKGVNAQVATLSLDPQITIGLLTDGSGFPLAVEAFEGNRAETATMLPTIRAFMTADRLTDGTVVADAGMVSASNQRAVEAEGLSFILPRKREVPPGARIPTSRTSSAPGSTTIPTGRSRTDWC